MLTWYEPDEDGHNKQLRITEAEAIRRARTMHEYASDAEALEDFMAIHWAWKDGE